MFQKHQANLAKPLMPYLLCLAIGAGGGGLAVYWLYPRTITMIEKITDKETEVAQIPVRGEAESKIQYAQRAEGDPAQVKIDTGKPQVVAEINGKQFGFEGITGEKHAFEKGQLVLRQSSTTTLDLTQWANKELAAERERIKKEYCKPHSIGIAAMTGARQSYVGIEYANKALEIGGYKGLRGAGDKYMAKIGARWMF
jgi:hypothetical protein